MEIREIMSANPEYIYPTTTLEEAALKMRELDTGFLPIGDESLDKIIGTITDRDIVVCGLANHEDLSTPVSKIMHKGVCYCFEKDDVCEAVKKMQMNQIRRLIVLNENKRLTGIVTLGDIATHCNEQMSGETLEEISKH